MKALLVFLIGSALTGPAFAGTSYTPEFSHGGPTPKLDGLAVQCVPIKGGRPIVRQDGHGMVSLLCKPQALHIRGIEANESNLKLLFSGSGYDSALKVYRLHYQNKAGSVR